jgi:predicted kinase
MSHRTYARLLECAESCLKCGFDTIVDAAFLNGAKRRLFSDLAVRGGFHFVILACEANLGVLARRVEERIQRHVDADSRVLAEQLQHAEPLSAHERMRTITIDTTTAPSSQRAFVAIKDHLASRRSSPPAAWPS